jgi:hypothetical protein
MGAYDTGGFGTLGNSIDGLCRGLEQTRMAIEWAGVHIGASADRLHEQLSHTTTAILSSSDTLKASVDTGTNCLINALRNSDETASKNAQEIKDQIAQLSLNLAHASAELKTATLQSSRLSGRLNLLTGALVFAAILPAGAAGFQAYETKRQADVVREQFRTQSQSAVSPQTTPPQPQPVTPSKK